MVNQPSIGVWSSAVCRISSHECIVVPTSSSLSLMPGMPIACFRRRHTCTHTAPFSFGRACHVTEELKRTEGSSDVTSGTLSVVCVLSANVTTHHTSPRVRVMTSVIVTGAVTTATVALAIEVSGLWTMSLVIVLDIRSMLENPPIILLPIPFLLPGLVSVRTGAESLWRGSCAPSSGSSRPRSSSTSITTSRLVKVTSTFFCASIISSSRSFQRSNASADPNDSLL
mmetsp:Transcript_7976/g.18817  ORF Transcript_7976/g.18817 Transcript_7976/m.18817 type:complete len:227 (-) Transcript_7976:1019-1699(-)